MKKQEKGLLWLSTLLVSLSGSLNALGIMIFAMPVSHFTGNTTHSSIAFANGNFDVFFNTFSTIVFFLLGNIFSGYVLGDKEFNPGKRYGGMLILIGSVLMIDYYLVDIDQVFLCVLSFLCGIQNGLFITYKGMTVRMTHITGSLTDMGVHIGNYLKKKHSELWRVKFYFTLIVGFFTGGVVGTLSFHKVGRQAFLFISLGYIFSGILYFLWRSRGLKTGTLSCK